MEVARSVLLGRSLQFQSCEAKTEGNSRIRPGNRLTVKYLGRHSDGEYLVYSVEHDFSVQDGYFTTCHLKRNFCGVSNNRSISAIDRERIDRQGANAQGENAASTSASGNHEETQNDTEESNVEEKSPKISNPRWENADNQTITKALVGDEVFLCADTENISDGTSAKIKVIEKDDDGNDDFVTELSAAIQDGKIRRKWKVVYTEDNDDTDSQKELEEKGYTLPEYAFTVESIGVNSEESGQLDVMGWIKARILDKKNKRPVKNMPYKIYYDDGTKETGTTDGEGYLIKYNLRKKYKYIELEF